MSEQSVQFTAHSSLEHSRLLWRGHERLKVCPNQKRAIGWVLAIARNHRYPCLGGGLHGCWRAAFRMAHLEPGRGEAGDALLMHLDVKMQRHRLITQCRLFGCKGGQLFRRCSDRLKRLVGLWT